MRALLVVLGLGLACGGSETTTETPKTAEQDDRVALGDDRTQRRSGAPGDGSSKNDDGMQVEGLKGHLAPADVQTVIQKHSDKLTRCYHGKLSGRAYVGGNVELAYVVDRGGAVKTVAFKTSDLGDWSIESCLLGVARAMKFPEPEGNADAEFSVPLEFSPQRQPMWWGEARVSGEVGDKLSALDECPDAPADVLVTLYVGPHGAVSAVGFADASGGPSESWAECAKTVITAWTLSDPRGKIAKLSFSYPSR